MFRLTILLAGISASLLPVWAETAGIEGPISGYVYDAKSRDLRPVMGMPGAAYLGPAVSQNLDLAGASPDGTFALGSRDGRLLRIRLKPEIVEEELAAGTLTNLAYSADSSAAAVATTDGLLIWRASGFERVMSPAGEVQSLAMDGGRVLAGIRGKGVYLLSPEAAPLLLAEADAPQSLAVSNHDLFMADSGRHQLSVVRDYASGGNAVLFSAESADAVAAAGDVLFAVSTAERKMRVFHPSNAAVLDLRDLDFEPSELSALGSSRFQVKHAGEGPVQLLDGRSGNVYFVPADPAASN